MNAQILDGPARSLVSALRPYRGQRPIILALSERRLPLARLVAEGLGGEADLFLSRPVECVRGRPPGFVWEEGQVSIDSGPSGDPAAEARFAGRIVDAMKELLEDRAKWSHGNGGIDPRGRVAIVVAEGTAGGDMFVGAVRALKARGTSRVIAAFVACSQLALARMRHEIADIVCLHRCETLRDVARNCARGERGRDPGAPQAL